VKTTDELRALCELYPKHADFLESCATKLEEARQWKLAWAQAELKNDQLTRELELIRLNR
jgi:hypothetical protein